MIEVYAGLDVSDKTTHICAVDKDGKVVWRGGYALPIPRSRLK